MIRLGGALAVGTAALGAFVACSGAAVLNGLSSNSVYERTPAVPFGDHPRQVLDVYRPKDAVAPAPTVVFFYGGGWTGGARGMYEFVASSLTREGYVVVVPDYRLFPDVTFPAFAEDAARAVAWVQANIGAHGGDPDRIALMGHSAGAHLATLVALDGSLMTASGGDPARLRGVVGLAGAYDFLPLDEGSELQRIFPEPVREASQPVHHVGEGGRVPPPMLLVHGLADETVIPRNTRRLVARLEAAGGDVETSYYEGVGHRRLAAALAPALTFVADTRGDVLDWLGRHLD